MLHDLSALSSPGIIAYAAATAAGFVTRHTSHHTGALLQHYIGGRSLAMAEITADDAKHMSCAKLTKLGCWYLVEADRGEPCGSCRYPIKQGYGDNVRCSEKAAPPAAQRSRRTKKDQAPAPTLQPYPVCRTSPILPTVDEAVTVYGASYAGKRVEQRQGYETPRREHRTPLVLQLLDDDGERVIDERRIVRMTGWEVVAKDWERHLGVFGFDPRRVEQVYSIRRCDVVDRIPVTPYIRDNLSKYSVDALVSLASRNGLIDKQSVLCDCFTMLAGAIAALAHDPEAQKEYCETLVDIVGDLGECRPPASLLRLLSVWI